MAHDVAGAPIVVGVDGSDSATQAALWAAAEAAHRRLPLVLVNAAPIPASTYTDGFSVTPNYVEALKTKGLDYLAREQARVAEVYPQVDLTTKLFTGQVVRTLVEQSRDARLVVLGSRGLGGVSGVLVGSTAVGLVSHGRCPVAVIRGRTEDEPPPTTGPVVVGVDGSRAGETAVELAFEEASMRGAELVAVHTWTEFVSDVNYAYARQFMIDWQRIEEHECELLAEGLAGWQQKYPDVQVRRIVVRDRPVRQLLEQAERAQLLVVGSRGHGGFTGMLLGSTSQALIYHAPCPLLVARSEHAA
jgi:nucleotide-binding universal stress UspA family protein